MKKKVDYNSYIEGLKDGIQVERDGLIEFKITGKLKKGMSSMIVKVEDIIKKIKERK